MASKLDREILHRELYDHRIDSSEMNNIADLETSTDCIMNLSQLLQNGWQAAVPQID